jgi:hypothetical protein
LIKEGGLVMLEKEFEYYLANQGKLLKKYNNRYLVIVGERVVGDYDTHDDAYFLSQKKHKLGTFLIQKCTKGKGDYTTTIHSPAFSR